MTSTLAARVAALSPEQRARLRARIPQVSAARPELTPGQRRLLRTQNRVGGRPVDVVCQAVHLTGASAGSPDLDVLAERIRGFAQAHEALRTTFRRATDGAATANETEERPVVHDVLPPLVERTRCTDSEHAHQLARQLAAQPFDLENGPLLRATLAEGPKRGEAWLLFAVHNLVFDAWSFELLLDELARPEDTAPVAAPTFSAFAGSRRAWLDSAEGRSAAAYWAEQVADAPAPLPTDRPRGEGTQRTGGRVEFSLPRTVAEGITAAARREATTAYNGWLAVAWSVLAEFGGHDDVLLGTFTSGRTGTETADTVGYLLNVLPVRLKDPGDGSHRARTKAAGQVTRQGLKHAAYPGELIGDGTRVAGTHPLLDTVFVFDNLGQDELRIQGADVTTLDLDKGTARFDLTLAVYPGADGAEGWLEYDTGLYEEATARQLVERFTAAAHAAAEEGEAR